MMSAPTPSARLPHSDTMPDVSPTIISTKITWIAIAMMLSAPRNGRAAMLPQNIWSSENGPSNVSFFMLHAREPLDFVIIGFLARQFDVPSANEVPKPRHNISAL